MSITREQVADLQPGDVVELRLDEWEAGQAIRGPLALSDIYPDVLEVRIPGGDGRYWVRTDNGQPFDPDSRSLTVVSRAPRPLYVNHPRTEPVAGDVVAPPDEDEDSLVPGWRPTWARSVEGVWIGTHTGRPIAGEMLDRLRLLVDGETGQVVP